MNITVPAVAAALLTVPRDCETCGNSGWLGECPDKRHYIIDNVRRNNVHDDVRCPQPCRNAPDGSRRLPCPDCRMTVEWLAVDDPQEVGSTVHIVAGPAPEQPVDGYVTGWAGSFYRGEPVVLRPGAVVATGVVTECVPIVDRYVHGIDSVYVHPNGTLILRRTYTTDISDQRLDQDWSPTRPCPECGQIAATYAPMTVPSNMRHCAGSLPRYAIRLTSVVAQ